jgi:D-beta-D-heptose 7-phosphate kinase/D-beta-D-heptose 1-phosphate adenosyltransferase
VPIVDVLERIDMPGGAANCALNLARVGAQTEILGVIGRDCEGELLTGMLARAGVVTHQLASDPNRRTLFKARVMCDGHQIVRFDQGTTAPLDTAAEDQLLARLTSAYAHCDVVVVSDYSYGVLTPRVIDCIAELQRKHDRMLVVDSKSLPAYRHVGMTLCKPNFRETLKLLGRPPVAGLGRRSDGIASEGERMLALTGSQIVAITLDREGALVFERGAEPHRTFARSAPQNHTAGAGDTFLSTFGLAKAAGASTPAAAELAQAAAAVVVSKQHTATCSADELKLRLAGEQISRGDVGSLLPTLDEYRRQQRRIVLTNGCFDILHRGHIAYLEQARQQGDVLVVGVNSDESIRRLKGATRPINGLADRMSVLAALSCVDHVVSFSEDTPYRLIEAIRPDVFVKGGDYTRATLPEAELVERLGGVVKILSFVNDRSTTGIITRICKAYGEPSGGDRHNPAQPGSEHASGVVNRSPAAVRAS